MYGRPEGKPLGGSGCTQVETGQQLAVVAESERYDDKSKSHIASVNGDGSGDGWASKTGTLSA
jgi:hypothetical protein